MKARLVVFAALFASLLFAANAGPILPDLPIHELEGIAVIAIVMCFLFAAGRIADFLQSSGKRISKKEALYAPFAYTLFSMIGIIAYFTTGAWVPPQNTIITNVFYLLLLPAAIAIGVGALVLHSFFHDRLNPLQSLDLSMHIILAPIFDGIRGYWTALTASVIVLGISVASYFSSGMNFSLVTFDFLLASIIVSCYFLYRAFTSRSNEGRASNIITIMTIMAPSVLRLYFKDLVCAGLSLIPLQVFQTCPLLQVGNEVTLALSVAATLLLLVPAIPVIYAIMVNALRVVTVVHVLTRKEQPQERAER